MGRITDPTKAHDKSIPCHGFVIPPKTLDEVLAEINKTGQIEAKDVFLFKEGVLGALSDDDDSELCTTNNIQLEQTPPKLFHRWKVIKGLEEGKITCVESDHKAAAVLYLQRYARETVNLEEKEMLEKVIKDIASIPPC